MNTIWCSILYGCTTTCTYVRTFRNHEETDDQSTENRNVDKQRWGPKSCRRENHVLTIMVSYMCTYVNNICIVHRPGMATHMALCSSWFISRPVSEVLLSYTCTYVGHFSPANVIWSLGCQGMGTQLLYVNIHVLQLMQVLLVWYLYRNTYLLYIA